MEDAPADERWIHKRLWLRWARLWYGLIFLWAAGLALNLHSWRWLLWPFLSAAAFLIFGSWLRRVEPKIGGSLAFSLGLLLFIHNIVGTWWPFFTAHFPYIAQGTARWQGRTDVVLGVNIACDSALQESLGQYALASQDADAATLKKEFDALVAARLAGRYGAAEASRENELLQRYQQLVQRSASLRHMLSESGCAITGLLPTPAASSDSVPTPQAVVQDVPRPAPPKRDERTTRIEEFRSLLNTVNLNPGQRNIAVVVETIGSATAISPDQSFYGHLRLEGARFLTDLFKQEVITRGYFDQMYAGEKELTRIALNTSHVDYLVLGRLSSIFRSGAQIDRDLISCDLTLTYKVVDRNGDAITSDSFQVVGPGFSENAAAQRAAELLANQFCEAKLKPIL